MTATSRDIVEARVPSPVFKNKACLEDGLDHVLGEVGHVGEVVDKGHLGLHHLELAQVSPGVRVLGPEGRHESVGPGEAVGHGLQVELAGDGEKDVRAKVVLRRRQTKACFSAFIH